MITKFPNHLFSYLYYMQGSLNLSVIPQGISVVMSSSSLRVCANTAITIDASNSKDRDNRPGPLSYR